MPTDRTLDVVRDIISEDNSIVKRLADAIEVSEIELKDKRDAVKKEEDEIARLEKEIAEKQAVLKDAENSFEPNKATLHTLFEVTNNPWDWERDFNDAKHTLVEDIKRFEKEKNDAITNSKNLEGVIHTLRNELKRLKESLTDTKKLRKELIELINQTKKVDGGITKEYVVEFLAKFKDVDGSPLFENLAEAAQIVMFPENYDLYGKNKDYQDERAGLSFRDIFANASEEYPVPEVPKEPIVPQEPEEPLIKDEETFDEKQENLVAEVPKDLEPQPILEETVATIPTEGEETIEVPTEVEISSADFATNPQSLEDFFATLKEEETNINKVDQIYEQNCDFLRSMGFTDAQIKNPKHPISLYERTPEEFKEFIKVAREYGFEFNKLEDVWTSITYKNIALFRQNLEDIVEDCGQYYETEITRHPFAFFKATRIIEERDKNNTILSQYIGIEETRKLMTDQSSSIPSEVAMVTAGITEQFERAYPSQTPYAYIVGGEYISKTKFQRNLNKLLAMNSGLSDKNLILAACVYDGTRDANEINSIASAFGINLNNPYDKGVALGGAK